MEKQVGVVWAVRINAVIVTIIGLAMLMASRLLEVAIGAKAVPLFTTVLVLGVYAIVSSCFYIAWLQLPISSPFLSVGSFTVCDDWFLGRLHLWHVPSSRVLFSDFILDCVEDHLRSCVDHRAELLGTLRWLVTKSSD